ncbi:MAG: GNAT family N-acetyltransferase, partial [Candidatus Bathycorpusculaceae bacterium]
IGRIDTERESLVGHILTIDVAPAYRRRRIAQRLLQEIERLFKEKGAKMCRLEVREDNVAALNLYKKLGYEKVERLERYYKDAHGLYLKKVLTWLQ